MDQLRFFDQLTGNPDRFRADGSLSNKGNVMLNHDDGKIYGIDNGLCFFNKSIPDFSLLHQSLSNSDLMGMYKSLQSLEPDFASMGRSSDYNSMMDGFRAGALTYQANARP
jgi:hypothetical protein